MGSDKPEFTRIDPSSLVIVEGQAEGTFTVTGIGQPVMTIQRVDATVKATLADQTLTAPISIKPETPATPVDALASTFTSPQTQQLELDILQALNQYRISKQLPAFAPDQACATQARAHSIDMAAGRVPLGHDGFDLRCAAIGSAPGHPPGAAEQVAAGQQTALDVLLGWEQEKIGSTQLSPIDGLYSMAGVGVARSQAGVNYFTISYA